MLATQNPAFEASAIDLQEKLPALEAQHRSLQTLVAELLLANQKLRSEIAHLRQKSDASAPATHPPPLQDR
jgi:hypothetical protein